ncbi:hypothetical protein [Planobispora longispora]|uniref:hypothetical protein n=1 Tax=Planobispora longispora TaxID=28887 RepID=UPI003613479E
MRTSPSPVRRAVNPLRHRIVVTGLVLVLLQAAWLVFVVGGSFFKEDDFQLIVRVTDPEMGWDGLLEPVGGRFVPGVLAVVWAAAWLDVYGWGLVTAIVVTVQALASVAVLRMLVVAFGERKAILAPFALYLFWPLAVPSLAWWSAALPVAGLHLALAMAVSSYLLRVRRGRRAATGVVVWTLVGSCFSAAALLIPVLLLAVHAVFLLGGRGAVRRVLRGSPVLWTLYGTLTAALGAVHLAARIAGQDVTPPAPGDAAGFVVRLLGETTATALVGGPFQWYLPRPDHGLALPDPPVTVTAWIVIVVVVWASSRVRGVRGAAPAWGILLGYVLLSALLPALLWTVGAAGPFAGAETRLVADATPVAAFSLAAAFLPLVGERDREGGRPVGRVLRVGGTVLVAAVVAASLWSGAALRARIDSEPVRDYLATAAGELARTPSSTQIYDTTVPRELMSSWFGDDRLTSRVLAPLAPVDLRGVLREPVPSSAPLIFDETGRLRPMGVFPVSVARAPGGCWPLLGNRVDIPLDQDLPRRTYTVALSYTATSQALAVFSYGGEQVRLSLRPGPQAVYLQITGGGSAMRISQITSGTGLCVSGLSVGAAVVRR